MVNHIQIIGEAAANLSREIRERYPEIPWGDFGIDLQEIWDTVTIDLPVLKDEIYDILRQVAP